MDSARYYKESPVLRRYIEEIERYPILGEADQYALALRMVDGDEDARESLIRSNLRMVVRMARSLFDKNPDRADLMELIQAGGMGLMHAASKYNPFNKPKEGGKPAKYSSYAWGWVRTYLNNEFGKQTTVKYPTKYHQIRSGVEGIIESFLQDNDREPTLDELQELTHARYERIKDISPANVDDYFTHYHNVELAHLSDPITGGGDLTIGDLLMEGGEDEMMGYFDLAHVRERVIALLEGFDETPQAVLRLRFGVDDGIKRSQAAVGKLLDYTGSRIQQIEKEFLPVFRKYVEEDGILQDLIRSVSWVELESALAGGN
tara:strand:+ start:1073 stop:2026 length:954 start_codon:yes stop_codon:yes gene_type:complete